MYITRRLFCDDRHLIQASLNHLTKSSLGFAVLKIEGITYIGGSQHPFALRAKCDDHARQRHWA